MAEKVGVSTQTVCWAVDKRGALATWDYSITSWYPLKIYFAWSHSLPYYSHHCCIFSVSSQFLGTQDYECILSMHHVLPHSLFWEPLWPVLLSDLMPMLPCVVCQFFALYNSWYCVFTAVLDCQFIWTCFLSFVNLWSQTHDQHYYSVLHSLNLVRYVRYVKQYCNPQRAWFTIASWCVYVSSLTFPFSKKLA